MVEAAVDVRNPGVSAPARTATRIVAAIAVTRKFDPLGAKQNIHAGAIKRRAEGIGVQRLAPLVVSLLVAMTAVRSVRKSVCREKFAAFDSRVSRRRDGFGSKGKTVGLANARIVSSAGIRLLCALILAGPGRGQTGYRRRCRQYEYGEHNALDCELHG